MKTGGENKTQSFNYHVAFARNIGFLSQTDQERIRNTHVAVAGLGGTGGAQAEALARLGVEHFTLADPDHYELVNFNRQVGATMSTIGKNKAEVMRDRILEINPEATVRTLTDGIPPTGTFGNAISRSPFPSNPNQNQGQTKMDGIPPTGTSAPNESRRSFPSPLDTFLENVDIVIDSLDFYAFEARLALHRKAREHGIWVINVAPAAIGATVMVFDPEGMSFEDYFDLHENLESSEKFLRMFSGTNPSLSMGFRAMTYLRKTPFLAKMGKRKNEEGLPCIGPVFYLIAGVTATEVFNLVCQKLPVKSVPTIYQIDAMTHKAQVKKYRWGMKSPWQRMKKFIFGRMLRRPQKRQGSDPRRGLTPPAFSPERDMLQNIVGAGNRAIQLHGRVFHPTPQLKLKVREFSRLSIWKGLAGLAEDWAIMVACFAVAIQFPTPLIWIAAAILIGARQHGLLIMGHEAIHYRLSNNQHINDRIANWFIAYPLVASIDALRRDHLAHHFYLFSEKDTEEMRKRNRPGWEFPVTNLKFWEMVGYDLFGGSILPFMKFLLTKNPNGMNPSQGIEQAQSHAQVMERSVYYTLAAVVITFFGLWIPVLLLWFLPAFTVLPAIFRIRNIAEHFGVPREHDLNMSRNTIGAPAWERFLIGPRLVGYHLDHHLYPSVPFYNYPKLHAELMKHKDYAAHAYESTSYLGSTKSVLSDVTEAAS